MAKLCKYLPEFGVSLSVVTVKDILYYAYDRELLTDVPSETVIIRAGSLDPFRIARILGVSTGGGNAESSLTGLAADFYRYVRDLFCVPDAQVLWVPFAVARAVEVVEKQKPDVIFGSLGPPSNVLVAYLVAALSDLPLVVDYRDGWTTDRSRTLATRFHRAMHRSLEKRILGRACGVTAYHREALGRIEAAFPEVMGDCITREVTNGFDEEDFSVGVGDTSGDKTRVVYMGSLYKLYEENLRSLVIAVGSLEGRLRRRLVFEFVGETEITPERLDWPGEVTVHSHGYLSHSRALEVLRSADMSLLLIESGNTQMVTGKLFEYLRAEPAILAIVEPESACVEVIQRTSKNRWVCGPKDVKKIADALRTTVVEEKANGGSMRRGGAEVEQFSRRQVARRMAGILHECAK